MSALAERPLRCRRRKYIVAAFLLFSAATAWPALSRQEETYRYRICLRCGKMELQHRHRLLYFITRKTVDTGWPVDAYRLEDSPQLDHLYPLVHGTACAHDYIEAVETTFQWILTMRGWQVDRSLRYVNAPTELFRRHSMRLGQLANELPDEPGETDALDERRSLLLREHRSRPAVEVVGVERTEPDLGSGFFQARSQMIADELRQGLAGSDAAPEISD